MDVKDIILQKKKNTSPVQTILPHCGHRENCCEQGSANSTRYVFLMWA